MGELEYTEMIGARDAVEYNLDALKEITKECHYSAYIEPSRYIMLIYGEVKWSIDYTEETHINKYQRKELIKYLEEQKVPESNYYITDFDFIYRLIDPSINN